MVVKTLEELKRENAEEQANQQNAQAVGGQETEALLNNEAVTESQETGDEEEQEVPAWLAADEQTSAEVPVRTHVGMKQKLKGRLREKDDELATLRQEIESLKTSGIRQENASAAAPSKVPRPEDFYDRSDPDLAYETALQNWMDSQMEQKLQTSIQSYEKTAVQRQQTTRVSDALDEHYNRAAHLVSDGLVTAEDYQAADTLLRQSVDAVAPGSGDVFVDSLLSRLGDGSEKVVMSMSRNPAHLAKFQQSLRDDPTGISAAAFLGELRGRFSSGKTVSRAPRPGTPLAGGQGGSASAEKKRYAAAHKAGNRQQAFSIRRAAAKRGIDVSTW